MSDFRCQISDLKRQLSWRTQLTAINLPPGRVETGRCVLRRWRVQDAAALKAVLDENVAHLKPWIPWRVAAPGTVEEITARIEQWSRDFEEGRTFIWAIWGEGGELVGGVGIYPRDVNGRVVISQADRAEIGYWLSASATGRGYATEAAREMVRIATTIPRFTKAEMRCDPRNERSIAVPRRLGFREAGRLVETPAAAGDTPEETVVWESALEAAPHD